MFVLPACYTIRCFSICKDTKFAMETRFAMRINFVILILEISIIIFQIVGNGVWGIQFPSEYNILKMNVVRLSKQPPIYRY